jgi:O-acetyl-ADP-ribose deacetylase (regulator of RNase III)
MITYLKGDATVPQTKGPKLIVHISNSAGGWGAGFVLAISKRWGEPEAAYRAWHHARTHKDVYGDEKGFSLGRIQVVQVKSDTWVVNMIAQEGMRTGSKGPPIRYEALEACLKAVAAIAEEKGASIHAPRIGCGLAGGKWEMVEPIISRTITRPVYIYDWNP